MQDHYKTLGLLSSADDVVIKAAFKALAQKYHPDKYKGDISHAQKVMAELNVAFASLKTKARRQAYDEKFSAHTSKHSRQSSAPTKDELHKDLVQKIKRNGIDEVGMITLFEELFDCKVKVHTGWINTYSTVIEKNKVTFDFVGLKTKIVAHLES
ncbi:MAG: J domain-containing protein [Burkholderiales bacterium]|nr:J domain-containing protein [Burkholderiales bacterium]